MLYSKFIIMSPRAEEFCYHKLLYKIYVYRARARFSRAQQIQILAHYRKQQNLKIFLAQGNCFLCATAISN